MDGLVGEVGCTVGGVAFLGLLACLHSGRRLHSFLRQGCRKLFDALQVKRVVQLEGENELLQLHLAIAAGEDSRASRDGQVGVLVGDVSPLHGDMAVVAEVETVQGLIPIAILLGVVRDESAQAGRDA